jgi:hypothetical protein
MDILKSLARFLNKKAQGLPIYAVVVIVLGIVVLAVVLIYILMVSGKGADISKIFFNLGGNVSKNASCTAANYGGGSCPP